VGARAESESESGEPWDEMKRDLGSGRIG